MQRLIRCFLTDTEVYHLGLCVLDPWDIVTCKSSFSILWRTEGIVLFYWFFKVYLIFVKYFSYFSVAGADLMASVWHWCVSLQAGCFGTLGFSKIQVLFLSFWWYYLILRHFFKFIWFFDRLLIFVRCKDDFDYLGLMLVFLTMGGGLECFFRMRYQIFLRVTTCVTTHVAILLSEFCTLATACLTIHFQWNKYIFVSFSTIYYALPSNFWKKNYFNFFLKKADANAW